MSQVLAIEVCVRVASIHPINQTKPNPRHKGCQGEVLAADGRARRVFRRIMALRNRESVMP
jgi:hypothetical protein